MYHFKMSAKSFVSNFRRSCDGLLDRVRSGEDEAIQVRQQMRKRRVECDVNRELKAIHVLNALFTGAVVRKRWDMYSTILSRCDTEE